MKLKDVTQNVKTAMTNHAPEIFTGFGIAGMLTTTVLAVKATPKALKLIEDKKEELNTEKLTVKETIKTTWKCYVPSVLTATISTAFLVEASKVHLKRNAILATAYKIAETANKEYREKVIETIGEKKEEKIRDEIVKDKMKNNPVSNNTVILTDKGNTLCFDPFSGRYFNSDIDKIRKAANELNRRMRSEFSISLNEYYDEIGLSHTDAGDLLGWNIDRGYIDIRTIPDITEDEKPCIGIGFVINPDYKFE